MSETWKRLYGADVECRLDGDPPGWAVRCSRTDGTLLFRHYVSGSLLKAQAAVDSMVGRDPESEWTREPQKQEC